MRLKALNDMRLKALLGGAILIYAVMASLFLTGGDPQALLLRHLVAYIVVGAGYGFFSPERGWRIGLWLVAPWFAIQVLGLLFVGSGDYPQDAKESLTSLLENMMVIIAACFGAAAGGAVGRSSRPLKS